MRFVGGLPGTYDGRWLLSPALYRQWLALLGFKIERLTGASYNFVMPQRTRKFRLGTIVPPDQRLTALGDRDGLRRCSPCCVGLDLLYLDGEDLRNLPLLERKRRLKRLPPGRSSLITGALTVDARVHAPWRLWRRVT